MSKETQTYKYSLMKHEDVMLNSDNLEFLREGLEYFGSSSWIRYNDEGTSQYELETLLGEYHA